MDNICHTLVGAALAEAGLRKKTALGSATLMIAANLPDVDVLAVPLGQSLGFRRGLTHGVPAQLILPFVLAGLILLWHRWRGRGPAPDPRWLVALSAIGIATHPFLDWMNTYGMRWLMPIDADWSYADALFIVDPWILIVLAAGVWRARRDGVSSAPARLALAAVALYIAAMAGLTRSMSVATRAELVARGITADTVVVDPVALNSLRRRVIYHWEGAYHLASTSWPSRGLTAPWFSIPLNASHPAVAVANATPAARQYHSWARLPYYVIEERRDTIIVSIGDARYTLDGRSSWAAVQIPVARSAIGAVAACETATPRRVPCAP